jgi:hypothetical protein
MKSPARPTGKQEQKPHARKPSMGHPEVQERSLGHRAKSKVGTKSPTLTNRAWGTQRFKNETRATRPLSYLWTRRGEEHGSLGAFRIVTKSPPSG